MNLTKKEIRDRVAGIRDALSAEELESRSKAIEDRLFAFEPFTSADTVMFFVSFRSEVLTEGMIKRSLAAGKRVVVPVTNIETRALLPSELASSNPDAFCAASSLWAWTAKPG